MSEIEKMKRYIERTKLDEDDRFYMSFGEAAELARLACADNFPVKIVALAFEYGKAKGYRAAKAEGRAKA